MGTRNLQIVKFNGKTKVAQYCQWDGYPPGQGVGVLEFLRSMDLSKFKEAVSKCEWISEDALTELYRSVYPEYDPGNGLIPYDLSNVFAKKYPQFHRDTGSDIYALIQKMSDEGQNVIFLNNAESFGDASIFCEYTYVTDLDQETLTVYQGGPKPEYLMKTFKFSELPTREDFCEQLVEIFANS